MSEPSRLRANTKTVAARPTPRGHLPRQPPRNQDVPRILDALRDQHGGRWIRYGTTTESFLFAAADIVRPDVDMNRRLVDVDPRCVLPAGLHRVKREIAERTKYRDALVAAHAGWLKGHYVLGSGEILLMPGDSRDVIAAFDTSSKFDRCGSLVSWQTAMGPVVSGQSYLLFALALALVGPLLRLMPAGQMNPLFELVGRPKSGKSTAAILAASVWAGDPSSDCGGGESWRLTSNRIDEVKQFHRDNLLMLDEAAHSGATARNRQEQMLHAVFGLASTGSKQRFGDGPRGAHARVALISTTNRPLNDLVRGSEAEREALHDRMTTLEIATTRPHGVLDFVPHGYRDARTAVQTLRQSADQHYGSCGRAFIRKLQLYILKYGDEQVRDLIKKHLEELSPRLDARSSRVQKSFAAVIIAGLFAKRFGVIPPAWGSITNSVLSVAHEAYEREPEPVDPLDRIRAYLAQHSSSVVDLSRRTGPVSPKVFERSVAFTRDRDGRREVLFPAASFHQAFPDYREVMRALGVVGRTRTEGGVQPKLAIKAPTDIGGSERGRVYCILIDSAPFQSRSA